MLLLDLNSLPLADSPKLYAETDFCLHYKPITTLVASKIYLTQTPTLGHCKQL